MTRISIAAVSLALMLAACGQSGPPQEPDTPFAPEGTPPVDAPDAPTPGAVPGETPAFLRPVQGATITNSATWPGGGTLDYDTTAPVGSATALHRQAALDAGQTLAMDLDTGDGHMLSSGDRDGFAINIARRGTGSHVSISWNNLPAG